jgi:DNA recombination protein RmuC
MFYAAVLAVLAVILVLNLRLLTRMRSHGAFEAALESRLRDDMARAQQRQSDESRALREEVAASIQRFASQTEQRTESLRTAVTHQLSGSREEANELLTRFLTATTEMQREQQKQLEAIRGVVDQRLQSLQTDNAAKLEQMRQTVDEKLQTTLEKRLGESFRLVSERLEQVHKGLGEMQTLASGVGDLKRVLSNVTTRGAWGEVQLENLLKQILAPEQYERDVATTGTNERVEFAIKLPGNDVDTVWLPIDAKFPMETYQRLAAAAERGDAEAVEASARELETVVRTCAKTFSGKYLAPPRTTDFGILFLATESLYAEALRRPGLAEMLQSEFRVVLAGPTTFAALLNSLQMGFRTLAIQQRSSEVWKLLGDVKAQFGKYSQVLATIRKRLDQATQTVDDAAIRTRAIEKRLRNVETSEEEEEVPMLHLIAVNDGD